MNNCGSCKYYWGDRFMCRKTGKPAGYLHVKPCYEAPEQSTKTIMEEQTTTSEPETKVCKKCGRELPVSQFSKHKGRKDGLQDFCKDCMKKAYLDKNPPKRYAPKSVVITDTELIEELRRRGYSGTITKTIEYQL